MHEFLNNSVDVHFTRSERIASSVNFKESKSCKNFFEHLKCQKNPKKTKAK